MKISLDLTPKHLSVLVFFFEYLKPEATKSRDVRVARSILEEPVLKLRKKHLDNTSSLTLFTKKTRSNFSLKYHEAHYLAEFIALAYPLATSEYDRNVLRMITDKLNQKLA